MPVFSDSQYKSIFYCTFYVDSELDEMALMRQRLRLLVFFAFMLYLYHYLNILLFRGKEICDTEPNYCQQPHNEEYQANYDDYEF